MPGRVFTMPDLGEGLEEGEIVAWLVEVGDTVALNQPLVEVETAKAAVEIPSPFAGVVTALHGAPGGSIPVGEPLVTFDGGEAPAGEGVKATPPVRKLAKELGIDLASVAGTGPDGRITAEDVRAAAEGAAPAHPPPPVPVARFHVGRLDTAGDRRQPRTAGRHPAGDGVPDGRLHRAGSPARRAGHLAAADRDRGADPNGGRAPRAQRPVARGDVEERAAIHVGLAVDTERGLIVAVLRDAASHGIVDLAAEIKRLADGARSGSLTPAEMTGATVAVSNTGSYGSEAGTPILSPGTSITLAIGVIGPRALVVDGEVVARPACTLSCTFDHRVLDGATAGRALTDLVSRLENRQALGDLPA